MLSFFRLWLRKYTPLIASVYLFALLALCAGSLAILFEWRGSERVFRRVDRFCREHLAQQRADWAARFDHADALRKAGDLAAAEKQLTALMADLPRLSRLGPDGLMRVKVLERLVEIYEATHRPEQAVRACEALLRLNPGYAEETFLYGKALLASGKTEEGERQIRRSLEIDPNYTRAAEFLIARYGAAGRSRDALEVHDRYQKAFSGSLGMMDQRDGRIELLSGGNRVAARWFMPALEESPREYRMALGARPDTRNKMVDELRLNLRLPAEWGGVEIEWIAFYGPRPLSEEAAPVVLKVEGSRLEALRGLVRVSAIPDPQSAIPNPQSSIPNPQSPIPNPQSSILNPQSAIPNPQSSIPDPQSAIPNPQSAVPNPQSPGRFGVLEESVSLSARFAQAAPISGIDAIGVRMRSAKKLSDAARATVELARAQEAPGGEKEPSGE